MRSGRGIFAAVGSFDSARARLWRRRFEVVQPGGEPVERQARRGGRATEARPMEAAVRDVYHVTDVRCKEGDTFDQVIDFAFEDEPELRIAHVKVTKVCGWRRRLALTPNHVRERLVVFDERSAAPACARTVSQNG